MTIHKKHIQQINDELYDIFESSFDEIFVTDANGYVLVVNSECEKNYALKVEDFIGKHVKELQEMGIFYPSATLKVIESNQAIELVQKNKLRPVSSCADKAGIYKRRTFKKRY